MVMVMAMGKCVAGNSVCGRNYNVGISVVVGGKIFGRRLW